MLLNPWGCIEMALSSGYPLSSVRCVVDYGGSLRRFYPVLVCLRKSLRSVVTISRCDVVIAMLSGKLQSRWTLASSNDADQT